MQGAVGFLSSCGRVRQKKERQSWSGFVPVSRELTKCTMALSGQNGHWYSAVHNEIPMLFLNWFYTASNYVALTIRFCYNNYDDASLTLECRTFGRLWLWWSRRFVMKESRVHKSSKYPISWDKRWYSVSSILPSHLILVGLWQDNECKSLPLHKLNWPRVAS